MSRLTEKAREVQSQSEAFVIRFPILLAIYNSVAFVVTGKSCQSGWIGSLRMSPKSWFSFPELVSYHLPSERLWSIQIQFISSQSVSSSSGPYGYGNERISVISPS